MDREVVARIRPNHEDAHDMKNSHNMEFTELLGVEDSKPGVTHKKCRRSSGLVRN